ncbi:ABC transporter-like protein protein [Hoyosella subflava DQS3-9A1]|uniref:ABC transporter-like protein protein n=1 Tax=Hoyosella subflava (strain DSM 45089 / JCM 17490 / NBRC 109087 / DQS3-9A1) TaxID=443218 RepID=F6EL73_HOYSD|nr:ABC transporter-like protein protein [Hoyosella subflava DQS3-9A1]
MLQMEEAECGAASLTMILNYHGSPARLQEVREACAVSRNGVDALRIVSAARSYGMEAKGYRKEFADLHELQLPLIAFWNQNHFVVVEHLGRRSVRINDPASGRRTVSAD